jgi:HK97 family phage major capsid protein
LQTNDLSSLVGELAAFSWRRPTARKGPHTMKNTKELKELIAEKVARASAIAQMAAQDKRELTAEEVTEIDAIQGAGEARGQVGELQAQLDRAEKLEHLTRSTLTNRQLQLPSEGQQASPAANIRVKPIAGKLKSFTGANAERDAWVSGHYFAATLFGSQSSKQWLGDHGYSIRNAHSTGDNSKGGFLVPQETAATIIRLVEEFGVFRQNVGTVFPIASGSLQVPKRAGGFTVRHPGENQEIVESDAQFSMVELTPHKAAILTKLSSELNGDALPLLADFLTREFAFAFAVDEDTAGFIGDGSQAFNRVTGLRNALAAGAAATASAVNTFGGLTLAMFQEAMAKLKMYPGIAPKWYIHSAGYYASMDRLKNASGGNNNMDLSMGGNANFLGYPVVFTQVLPSALGASAGVNYGFFGDLSLACSMGDARAIEIASSDQRYFENDQIAVRATQRYDIQVHDRGTATEGASVVRLMFA